LLYTYFKDEQIPHVWHRLNEVHREIALQHFLDSLEYGFNLLVVKGIWT
jgi:hypothetical protein